jgi:hypothetical protein
LASVWASTPWLASTSSSEPSQEVDVAGGVDQIEQVCLAVPGLVGEAHGLGLDGDAALALELHGIEHLLLHLARGKPARELNQPVGQGRFSVVDMGDDREIADMAELGHGRGWL